MGKHLHEALGGSVPVIGVAKTPFKGHTNPCELLRGRSKKPLFITSEGVDTERAREHIRSMHGPFRIPTLLGKVDRLCRQARPSE